MNRMYLQTSTTESPPPSDDVIIDGETAERMIEENTPEPDTIEDEGRPSDWENG